MAAPPPPAAIPPPTASNEPDGVPRAAPPSVVTHCVEAFFTHAAVRRPGATQPAAPPNLVLARGTRLEVYALNYGPGPCLGADSSTSPPTTTTTTTSNCRLELVGSWHCWGVIADLAVLRGKGSSGQRDSLVLAVRDAKLSVVEWDDEQHCLRSGSLHSFEGDPALREACPSNTWGPPGVNALVTMPPRVATEPGGRCAAALLYGHQLAILPAFQADVLELLVQQEGGGAGAAKLHGSASVGNSYVVNLCKVASLKLSPANVVRHMTFLHGYTEPLLLLLHETKPTWGGRLKDSRDACALSALSINMRNKRQPVIWHVPDLPSDASRLLAVPRGGVLVLSQNLLLYYAQGGSCVMAINSNAFAGEVPPRLDPPAPPSFPPFPPRSAQEIAAATAAANEKAVAAAVAHAKLWAANVHPETVAAAARGAPKAPGLELEADGATGCWLSDTVALLSLKTGQLLLVSLRFEGVAASRMQVAVAGSSPVASCAVRLTPDLVFLGSTVGDSLLVRYSHPGSGTAGSTGGAGSTAAPSAKRRRLASLASFDMGGCEGAGLARLQSGGGASLGGAASMRGASTSSSAALYDDAGGLDGGSELYRSAMGRSTSSKLAAVGDGLRYTFTVLDSLMCLGPMRSTALTDLHLCESAIHPSLLGVPHTDHPQNRVRPCLLAAVGAGKSGALAIMRRGLVSDVVTAVPALSVHGAWSLHSRQPDASSGASGAAAGAAASDAAAMDGSAAVDTDAGHQHHALLLLSCTDSSGSRTMLLDCSGTELQQLTDHDVAYAIDSATVASGELLDSTAAVQVTRASLHLVRGSTQLLHELSVAQLLQMAGHPAAASAAAAAAAGEAQGQPFAQAAEAAATAAGVCIKYAQVRDPYVLLLLSDATALLLRADRRAQQLQLVQQAVPELCDAARSDAQAAVTAACIYTDTSGWVAAALGLPAEGQQQQQQQGAHEQQVAAAAAGSGDDDADEAMAEAAAGAPAAGEEDGAAAAAADQQQRHEAQEQREATEAAAAVKAERDAAAPAAAAADEAPDVAMAGADDDADGVLRDADVAATEAVTTAAAAAAVAAEDAAAAAGATPLGMAVAGAKAADAVEAAAAAAAAGGGDGASAAAAATAAAAAVKAELTGEQQANGDAKAAAAGDMSTPFQAAAGVALDGSADAGTAPAAAAGGGGGGAGAAGGSTGGADGQQQQQQRTSTPASFCCVMRAGGGLQIYALPGMTRVFEDAEALLGPQVLGAARPPSLYEEDVADEELAPSPVSELLLECFAGSSGSATGVAAAAAPLLVALRDDGSLLAYKAYKLAASHAAASRLAFRRLALDPALLGRESPAPPAAKAKAAGPAGPALGIGGMPPAAAPPHRLSRFDHLVTPKYASLISAGLAVPPEGTGAAAAGAECVRDAAGGPALRYSGVFVCGPQPLWLVACRGGLIAHPMDAGHGRVDAFCGFHNMNCAHGFITAEHAGDMLVCRLPVQLRLDQPWLTAKLPLRASPLALTIYPEAHLVAVAASRLAAPPRPFVPAEPGGDAVAAAAYATAEAASKAAGVEDVHEVLLLAPPGFGLRYGMYRGLAGSLAAAAAAAAGGDGSSVVSTGGAVNAAGAAGSAARAAVAVAAAAGWAGLPLWRQALLPGEEVAALKCVHLHEGGDEAAALESYIAVGCASAFGEDYPALGRLLLLQVTKQQHFQLEGGSETKISARLALQRDMAGPVTAIDNLRGLLILAVGHRVEVHFKQGNSLVKVTFFDGTSLMSSISLVKDFIMVGTAAHSAAFLRYSNALDRVTRERTQQVQQLSCDTDRLEVWAVEFLPNGSRLNQVMADGGGNLTVLVYDKQDIESWGGQKLLRRGAAHVGAWLCAFTRLKLSVASEAAAPVNRQALLGASAEGGLLLLSPFWDDNAFKRMASLHEELVYRLPHAAGLNPKAFQGRYARAGPRYGAGFTNIKPLRPADNAMLQGDMLWCFAGLDLRAQAAIADAVGADAGALLGDLRAMTAAANFL